MNAGLMPGRMIYYTMQAASKGHRMQGGTGMNMTLGERIAMLRRQKGMTQEELATAVGLSAQAVSKWERDESCPDILLLPVLARLLGVTVDALLTGEAPEAETRLVPAPQRKPVEQMLLKIRVRESSGAKVSVNVPLVLMRALMEHDGDAAAFNINGKRFENVDVEMLMQLIESGVVGKLVEVDDGGDHVEVYVE